ncbi:hypothetical protein GCM10020254_03510 [Streptomyces goshikiensis]
MPVPHAKALSPARRPGRLLIACTTVLLIVGPTAAAPAIAADSVSYDFESPSRKLPFIAINGFGRSSSGPRPGEAGAGRACEHPQRRPFVQVRTGHQEP